MFYLIKIKERVMQILNMRGGSIKAIRMIMRGNTIILYFNFYLNQGCINASIILLIPEQLEGIGVHDM